MVPVAGPRRPWLGTRDHRRTTDRPNRSTPRITADRPRRSTQHRRHGMDRSARAMPTEIPRCVD